VTTPLLTPSQTVGPFFLDCLLRADARRNAIAPHASPDERVRVEGVVYDGDGVGVPDAVLEIWQADASGRYADVKDSAALDEFIGFGRCGTDSAGRFWFETVKPGPVAFDATRRQAPHLNVAVFARGLLNHLFTRMYFPDDDLSTDPVLQHVESSRRATLVAARAADAGDRGQTPNPGDRGQTPNLRDRGLTPIYRFDVVLQGPRETVFFDFVPRGPA
jgi:protocatechuate 3,4-dioxygenase alpha subunit